MPLRGQDISFNPLITQTDFQKFSRLIAQGIFPSPVQPAGGSGLLRFDVGVAATVTGSYAKIADTGGSVLGGTLDVPVVNGGLLKPTLALRGSYGTLRGLDVYRLNTYGLELFLGKGFGPVTPYGAVGKQRSDATGTIPQTPRTPVITLRDRSTITRYTLGAAINLLILHVNVEANQAEARSYGARVSFGF
ncbi:MAG: hypothetical protein NVSMB68_12280 [Thermoanaerobaculia bacterium]